jgi:hypothetical protein
MKRARIFLLLILISVLPLMLSCGGDDGDSGVTTYNTAEYFPLGQGDTWTLSGTRTINGQQESDTFTLTISGTENIGGVVAVKRVEQSGNYLLFTNTNGITCYKEYNVGRHQGEWYYDVFNPPITILPAVVSIGTKQPFNSTVYHTARTFSATGTVSGDATVEGVENITVQAGTFTGCLKLKLTWNLTSSDGKHQENVVFTSWLAKGVGIVKATGQNTNISNGDVETFTWTEELVSATVGGVHYPK